MAYFKLELLTFSTPSNELNKSKFLSSVISEFNLAREGNKLNINSFCYSYDEKFSVHKNSQKELTFSMDKMLLKGESWIQNPFTDILKIGSFILLTDKNNNQHLFNVASISYSLKEFNTTYSYTCTDSFTYSVSKQNTTYSIDNDSSSTDFIGAKSLDWWAYKIWKECKLSYQYLPLKWKYSSDGEFADADFLRVKPAYSELTDKSYDTLFQTTIFSGSGSANSLLISLGELYGLNLVVKEFFDGANLQRFFWFEYAKSDTPSGLIYSPYTDVQSFNLSSKGDNLVSVLNVKGTTVGDDIVSVIPKAPPFFNQFFLSEDWKKTSFKPNFYKDICTTQGIEQVSIKRKAVEGNNTIFYFDTPIEVPLLYRNVKFGDDFNDTIIGSISDKNDGAIKIVVENEKRVYVTIKCGGKNYSQPVVTILPKQVKTITGHISYGDLSFISIPFEYQLYNYGSGVTLKEIRGGMMDLSFEYNIITQEGEPIIFSQFDEIPLDYQNQRCLGYMVPNNLVSDNIDFPIDGYIQFYRNPDEDELEFANQADRCPYLENRIIDFSYYYNNNIINKATYRSLNDMVNNTLRIVNGRLLSFQSEYLAALHSKTRVVADITNAIDNLGAQGNAAIINYFGQNGSIGDLTQFRLAYNQFFTPVVTKTKLFNYNELLSDNVNKFINAQQRFLKNIKSFKDYFDSYVSFTGGENLKPTRYKITLTPEADANEYYIISDKDKNTMQLAGISAISPSGEPIGALYTKNDGKSYNFIKPDEVVTLNNLQRFYILKDLTQYTLVDDDVAYDPNKKYFTADGYKSISKEEMLTEYLKNTAGVSFAKTHYMHVDAKVNALDLFTKVKDKALDIIHMMARTDYQTEYEEDYREEYLNSLETRNLFYENGKDKTEYFPLVNALNSENFYHRVIETTDNYNKNKWLTAIGYVALTVAFPVGAMLLPTIGYALLANKDTFLARQGVTNRNLDNKFISPGGIAMINSDNYIREAYATRVGTTGESPTVIYTNSGEEDQIKDPFYENIRPTWYNLAYPASGTISSNSTQSESFEYYKNKYFVADYYYRLINANDVFNEKTIDDVKILFLRDESSAQQFQTFCQDKNNEPLVVVDAGGNVKLSQIAFKAFMDKCSIVNVNTRNVKGDKTFIDYLNDNYSTDVEDSKKFTVEQQNGYYYYKGTGKNEKNQTTTIYFICYVEEEFDLEEVNKSNFNPRKQTYDAKGNETDIYMDDNIVNKFTNGYYYRVKDIEYNDVEFASLSRLQKLAETTNIQEILTKVKFYYPDYDNSGIKTSEHITSMHQVPTLYQLQNEEKLYTIGEGFFEVVDVLDTTTSFTIPVCKVRKVEDTNGGFVIKPISETEYKDISFEGGAIISIDETTRATLSKKVLDNSLSTMTNGEFWYWVNYQLSDEALKTALFEYQAIIESDLTLYWTNAHSAAMLCDYFLPESWQPAVTTKINNAFSKLIIYIDSNGKAKLTNTFIPSVVELPKTKKYHWYYKERNEGDMSSIAQFIGYDENERINLVDAYNKSNYAIENIKTALDEFGVLGDESDWTLSEAGYTNYYYATRGGMKWKNLLAFLDVAGYSSFDKYNGWYPMFLSYIGKKYEPRELTRYEMVKREQEEVWRKIYTLYPSVIVERDYTNDTAINSKDLLLFAMNYFRDNAEPSYSYSVTLIDSSHLKGYIGQELKVGDAILINAYEISPEQDDIYKALSKYLFISDISLVLRKDDDIQLTVDTLKFEDKLIQRLVKLIK